MLHDCIYNISLFTCMIYVFVVFLFLRSPPPQQKDPPIQPSPTQGGFCRYFLFFATFAWANGTDFLDCSKGCDSQVALNRPERLKLLVGTSQ